MPRFSAPIARLCGRQILTGLGLAVIVACGRASTTLPPPVPTAKPAVVEAPAAPPPRPLAYTIPSRVGDTRYQLDSKTTLERDSAGRPEVQELSSRAHATVRLRRGPAGQFEASGLLSQYLVTSALSTTPIAIDSLRFDAVLDALSLRVVSDPPLANECDRPETGALTLVRDVLIRLPATVTIGDHWADSTVQVVCRASLPMVVRTRSDYVVTDAERDGEGMMVLVRRTSASSVSGTTSSPWRSVEVSGTGEGTLDARVSVVSGAVQRIRGTSTLRLAVTDRTLPTHVRSQQVTQRVVLSADIILR